MKINIQNYESYFLSYIDNELSSTEKKEVELFIQENPVYAHELKILKQTVLGAEEMIFEDKVSLYRLEAMEAALPATFKKSLYREEATIVHGFFTKGRIKMMASIAAMLLLFLGYKMHFNESLPNSIQNQSNGLVSNYSPNSNSNSNNISNRNDNNTTNVKDATIVKNNSILEANDIANIQPEFTVMPGANTLTTLVDSKKASVNEPSFIQVGKTESNSTYVTPEPAANTAKTSVAVENSNYATIASHTPSNGANEQVNTNESSVPMTESEQYTNLNVDENDRTLYIANFEIDGEKLRGISRRINAIFKRNKNEKQK
jgi:hypothetical protein